MREEVKVLRERAEMARILFKKNLITINEAEVEIMPYINACNAAARAIAKRYGVGPRLVFFNSYIR